MSSDLSLDLWCAREKKKPYGFYFSASFIAKEEETGSVKGIYATISSGVGGGEGGEKPCVIHIIYRLYELKCLPAEEFEHLLQTIPTSFPRAGNVLSTGNQTSK